VEMLIELYPASGEESPADVYHAAAMLALSSDLEWRGFTTRAVGYGLHIAVATARSWLGLVSADVLEDACAELACVQNARVVRWYPVDAVCPFDKAWLVAPLRSPVEEAAASAEKEALRERTPRLGLVSTFRGAPDLEGWLAYHVAVGARAFFLYADTQVDAAEAQAVGVKLGLCNEGGGGQGALLRVVPVDEKLRREWEQLAGWSRYGPRLTEAGSALMARQCLNAEHAMAKVGKALEAKKNSLAAEQRIAAATQEGEGEGGGRRVACV